jgi:hypothetical protein
MHSHLILNEKYHYPIANAQLIYSCFYVFMKVSVHLSAVYLPPYLPVYLSVSLSIIYLSIHPSIHPSVSLIAKPYISICSTPFLRKSLRKNVQDKEKVINFAASRRGPNRSQDIPMLLPPSERHGRDDASLAMPTVGS